MNVNTYEKLEFIIQDIQSMISEKIDITNSYDDNDFLELIEECVVTKTESCYISFDDRQVITQRVFNSMKRNDILQPLLEDKDINEIMVNGVDYIYVEKKGRIYRLNSKFENEERLYEIIQNIVSKSNKAVNESNPIVDVMLEDGSRVNVVLNPLAINGPCITIRKFPETPMCLSDLRNLDMITDEASDFLCEMVNRKFNMLITGGTSTGKTTLLNALSNYIGEDERIITVEDSAELQLNNVKNLVRLETRDAGYDGTGEINMRRLIRTALRMRPDRFLVGEVRDEAALDMLQALNTGHDGSMSTLHANSAQDSLMRLETMVLCGALMPIEAIRHQIASAIELIIHIERDRNSKRRVVEIVEVCSVEKGIINLNPIFSARNDTGSLKKVSDIQYRKYKLH